MAIGTKRVINAHTYIHTICHNPGTSTKATCATLKIASLNIKHQASPTTQPEGEGNTLTCLVRQHIVKRSESLGKRKIA